LPAQAAPGRLAPWISESVPMSDFVEYLVPFAVAAVAVVLLLGLVNMMRGGSANRSQQLMRLRVLLQFGAIVVIMGVLWWRAV